MLVTSASTAQAISAPLCGDRTPRLANAKHTALIASTNTVHAAAVSPLHRAGPAGLIRRAIATHATRATTRPARPLSAPLGPSRLTATTVSASPASASTTATHSG